VARCYARRASIVETSLGNTGLAGVFLLDVHILDADICFRQLGMGLFLHGSKDGAVFSSAADHRIVYVDAHKT
jgi:hypothetical protein